MKVKFVVIALLSSIQIAGWAVRAELPSKRLTPEVSCQDDSGWETAKSEKSIGYQKLARKMSSSQLVFVAGFLNELFPTYYHDNVLGIRELFNLGDDKTHIITPSSRRSVESNASWLRAEILALHDKDPSPIIIVAHSKGAAESLSMLMAYPELIKDGIVRDLVSIQGAIFGSPIADLYSTSPSQFPMPDRNFLNWLWRVTDYGARRFDDWATSKLFDQGIESLETQNSRNRFAYLLNQLDRDDRELIDKRVHYVISHVQFKDATLLAKFGGWYLGPVGINDGVLLTSDQYSEDIGHVIAHYYADHTDLVIGRPASNLSKKCVANLTAEMLYRMNNHW